MKEAFMHSISICTFAMNRLEDVKKSVPHMVSLLNEQDELIFVDYSDPQQSGHWVFENIKDERVVVVEVPGMRLWHMNHARNCAALNASKDVFVFYDIDILVPNRVFDSIRAMPSNLWYGIGVGRNISGFAAISRDNFYKVSGYEEALVGHGYDDTNMHIRLRDAGIERVDLDHTHTVSFHTDVQVRTIEKDSPFTWDINRRITEVLRERHPFRNNINRNWGCGWIRLGSPHNKVTKV